MNKRAVLGLVAAIVVIAVSITLLSLRGQKPKESACLQLIHYIEANDAKHAYDLFSASGQKTVDYQTWQAQVRQLSLFWINAPAKLVSDAANTTLSSTQDNVTESYNITSGNSTYQSTCYFQKVNKQYVMNSYANRIIN
ncbi:MAG TPA: hypothetical protein VLF91_01800 [Candidatus Saccharimonadales bacterium]|nr:hypothetical protein [Candidatus Saccharimonadales bacterium]